MGPNGVGRESIVMRKEIANALARGLSIRKKMAADEGGSLSVHEVARRLKIGFFLQNHGILAGLRPVDLLRERRLDPVMKAVEAYA